jgi:hypothetical protein
VVVLIRGKLRGLLIHFQCPWVNSRKYVSRLFLLMDGLNWHSNSAHIWNLSTVWFNTCLVGLRFVQLLLCKITEEGSVSVLRVVLRNVAQSADLHVIHFISHFTLLLRTFLSTMAQVRGLAVRHYVKGYLTRCTLRHHGASHISFCSNIDNTDESCTLFWLYGHCLIQLRPWREAFHLFMCSLE